MTDYFEYYSISQSLQPDPQLLRRKWQELSRIYHPDRFGNATESEQAEALKRSAVNNEAYRLLTDPDRTLGYVLKLHGVLVEDEKYALPPDFLMEMMELNEAIDSGDNSGFAPAAAEMDAKLAPLSEKYNSGDRTPALLQALKEVYFRKKYLLRLKERLT